MRQKNDHVHDELPFWIQLRGISQMAEGLKITLLLRNCSFQGLRDIESSHSSAVQQQVLNSTCCHLLRPQKIRPARQSLNATGH